MDATPILAIPYPEPTDPITDYPAVAQDAAELLELLLKRVHARVQNVVGQAMADNTIVVATFEAEGEDPLGFHDPAVNPTRMTIPAGLGGLYLIDYHCQMPNPATTHDLVAWIKKNGAELLLPAFGATGDGNYGPSNTVLLGLQAVLPLVAGDYVEINVRQQSTASRTMVSQVLSLTRLSV